MTSLRILRHDSWAPPPVERAVATPAAALAASFQEGVHYRLLQREPGSVRDDLPVWGSCAGAIPFMDGAWGPVQRIDVPGVPGAFVLSNVLTDAECSSIAALSEAMGYTEDAPVSLDRRIRHNTNCVVLADDTLWQPIWRRVESHMPARVAGGRPLGLNQRWRLYKYGVDDVFRMHTDGSWPGSGIDEQGRLVRDIFGDRWSQLTFNIYLDSNYDGGETSFFVPAAEGPPGQGRLVSVAVPRGWVLCFFHGEHELSPLHEGSLVTRGLKRIVRSDVLYSMPGRSGVDAACHAE